MKLRSTLSVASLAVCAITATTGTAVGEPAVEPAVSAAVAGDSVIALLDHALFATAADGQSVDIRTLDGRTALNLPAGFLLDGQRHPIRYRIMDSGRALALTPDTGLHPIASPMEEQLALNDFATDMTRVPLGAIAGTVIGALAGAVIGLGSCLVVGPACLATAPAAIAAFAGAGGLAGTLVVGGALLADGLWKYLTTVQSAPGESAYAGRGGMLDPNGTGVPDANLRLPGGLSSGSSSGSGSGSASGSGGN
ncbi:hypothetical protein [Nocardia inohanensis]|uniref:hypothetical protein n=1 Tax=Nocardia inohanensis TaxID=209246 RepID=UPI00082AA8F8|nr:hypothetical protein [Nocardia inohanensis]